MRVYQLQVTRFPARTAKARNPLCYVQAAYPIMMSRCWPRCCWRGGAPRWQRQHVRLAVVVWVLMACAECAAGASAGVIFHSPESGATVSGRSFVIEVEVTGFDIPQAGKGVLLLDGSRLMELRQQHVTISMDGLGGLTEGQHSLRVLLQGVDGVAVDAADNEVLFIKHGSPEDTAGPFYDDRFDDAALQEMQEACSPLEHAHSQAPQAPQRVQTIALGMPVLSARKKYDGEEDDDMRVVQSREEAGFIQNVADLPMLKVFIPSLVAAIPHETRAFQYVIYLGFDRGDPVFDDADTRAQVEAEMMRLIGAHPVSFAWSQYSGMEGKVFWIYNDLFRQAYADGADYFYMVNDDLLLVTPGWAGRFVSALEGSVILPGFGVAGPLDIRDRHKTHMCFAFHSRLHYEVFGTFYPPIFENWWSDYWATLVYGPAHTFWFKEVEVRNTEIEGRRYPAFWEGNEMFGEEVAAGRRRIASFCRCQAAGGVWRFEACRFGAEPLSGPSPLPQEGAQDRAAQQGAAGVVGGVDRGGWSIPAGRRPGAPRVVRTGAVEL